MNILNIFENIKYAWEHQRKFVLVHLGIYCVLLTFYAILILLTERTSTKIICTTAAVSMGLFYMYIMSQTGATTREHHELLAELDILAQWAQRARDPIILFPQHNAEYHEPIYLYPETSEDLPDENF